MIDDPLSQGWRELQSGVCRLFNEIGLTADVEVPLKTPRGSVTVDVFAVDNNSVDKIQYIVECKNWSEAIPQRWCTLRLREVSGLDEVSFQEAVQLYERTLDSICFVP